MQNTAKPVIAGILNIITGVISFIAAISMFIGYGIVSGAFYFPGMAAIPWFVPTAVISTAIPTLIFALLALFGGIFALQRKIWGLALAGSIVSIIVLFPLGVASTVLIALSKDEF